MNRPDHHEPLSPEECALADRLARLGPHEGPSAALDAKILAAAHAAVAPPPRRRRWLGLTAVPGGLITGAGMAAALVVVVGLVWQLRPADPLPRPRGEGEIGHVSAEIIQRPQRVVAPAPPPPVDATVARALEPASIQRRAAPAPREALPARPVASAPPAASPPAAKPNANATVGPDEYRHYRDEDNAPAPAYSSAPMAAAPAAPAPPAAMSAGAAVAAQEEAAQREAFGLKRARQQEAFQETAAAADAETESGVTLDRIEVSGNRANAASNVAFADIPIDDDALLAPKAWLERIRQRRAAGDIGGARDSLTRFRTAHPDVRVPRDLRALAPPRTSR